MCRRGATPWSLGRLRHGGQARLREPALGDATDQLGHLQFPAMRGCEARLK